MKDIRILKQKDDKTLFFSGSQSEIFCDGPLALIQLVIRFLLTTPGRDVFLPAAAGGLGDLSRRIRVDTELLKEEFSSRVILVRDHIIRDQQNSPVPENESLKTLNLVDIKRDLNDPSSIHVSIAMSVADGSTYQIEI